MRKKCAVVHVKRGCVKQTENMEIDELKSIKSLGKESTYKFLGVLENSRQEDKLVLENALKEYWRRLAIIWSSPLSDHYKVVATKQLCATCVIVFNVDADVATGAATTSRQRGKKDNSRIWRKTPPRINSYTIHEYEVWGERIKIGRDNIQGYQDQGAYEALL